MTVTKLLVPLLGVALVFGTTAAVTAQTPQPSADKPAATKSSEAKPAAKAKTATGKVKSVSPESLVVDLGKKDLTFAIGGDVAEAAKKLKAGDRVTVAYTEADGKMTATKVTGKDTAKTAKKGEKPAQPCAAKAQNPCAAKKQ